MNATYYSGWEESVPPMDQDDLLLTEALVFGLYNGEEITRQKAKAFVNQALQHVNGVLGVRGGLRDVFKAGSDPGRGIYLHIGSGGRVRVSARIIVATGTDSADVISDAVWFVTKTLKNRAGLNPERVNIRIAETMTRKKFAELYEEGNLVQ